MSLDLKDLRAKITSETDCALEAVARVRGVDRSEIVREVLHAWALQQIDTARVMHSLLKSEGLARESKGTRGNLDWDAT